MNSTPTDRFEEARRGLQGLSLALAEASFVDKAAAVEALQRKLVADELLVVVVGEFKRGKSTLINALLGRALLPVAAVPLTAVVTVVRPGKKLLAAVEFLNGSRREVAVESVVDYVAEERNPGNAKKVARVVVETPSALLERGIVLVDTPGVGSVYRHNTEVAERYLPEADAVIMVLSADPPIGATEVEFLRSARRWAQRLFIVLNKIDHLDAIDLSRAAEFTKRVVREALGDPRVELHALSAKRGLEARLSEDSEKEEGSGLVQFRRSLLDSLARERRGILIDSVVARARQILDTALFETDAAISAASARPLAWKEASVRLLARLAEIREKQYELTRVYSAKLEDLRREFEEALYEAVRRRSRQIETELEKDYAVLHGLPADEFRAAMNKAMLDSVESFFTDHLSREEPVWAERFRELTDRFAGQTVELLDGVMREAAETVGARYRPLVRPVLGVPPPAVWFVLEPVSVWTGGIQSMPTLRVFKPFFWKAVRRGLAQAMDVNAGRVRHDNQRRVEKAGEEALTVIREFFQGSTDALERTLREVENRRESAGVDAQAERRGREAVRESLGRSSEFLDRVAGPSASAGR